MSNLKDWLSELDLTEGAGLEEIKKAYRDMMMVWHPDRFSGNERLRLKAETKAKAINAAYKSLVGYAAEAVPSPSSPTPSPPASPRRRQTRQDSGHRYDFYFTLHDYEERDHKELSLDQGLDLFRSFDWSGDLEKAKMYESGGDESCPPTFTISFEGHDLAYHFMLSEGDMIFFSSPEDLRSVHPANPDMFIEFSYRLDQRDFGWIRSNSNMVS
ncbi:J domain-containing protein [Rubrivirga sp.]|uniref:J domain-containing protein n=1 Tax=Rubrivirga sp. TaxID=1885344 RepID=UPI003B522DFE